VKILLAEDDVDLSDVTAFALRRQGYTVFPAYSGTQAIESFQAERPDLVLVDIGIPDGNGLEVVRRIRQDSDTPLIMLTARADEPAMVEAFSAGADDYVTKPFSFRQLSLRVQAVSRRVLGRHASTDVTVGPLTIDPDNWAASCNGTPLALTRLEFRILYCLASHAGRVTPTDRLLRFVWRDDGGDGNVLKTHISHIRHKLTSTGAALSITSIPQVGYTLALDGDPDASSADG
jgi:DNA-binding response OmpR family regulator